MERTLLHFSIRNDAKIPLEQMRVLVENALGCQFHEGEYQKIPALVTKFLGMRVGLFEWAGIGGREVFRLQSYIDDARLVRSPSGEPVDVLKLNLSEALIDLLSALEAGQWYTPTAEDIRAEREHGNSLLQRYRIHERE